MKLTFEELKKMQEHLKYEMSDEAYDFCYGWSIESDNYFCDCITEYADSNTSVYSYDQREFYNNNVELCENALLEFGYDLNDMVKNGDTLEDIICKAGAIGQFKQIEETLYEDFENIKKLMVLNYLVDKGLEIFENEDEIEDLISAVDTNDRLSVLYDLIEEKIDEENEEDE